MTGPIRPTLLTTPIFRRFDCYIQGTDHAPLVVVHCCVDPRSVRYGNFDSQSAFTWSSDVNPLPQPFSTLLYARMGNGIATNQLMKMVAGAINPGRPVANLYVSLIG